MFIIIVTNVKVSPTHHHKEMIELFDVTQDTLPCTHQKLASCRKPIVLAKRFFTLAHFDYWGKPETALLLRKEYFPEYQLALWELERKYSLTLKRGGYKLDYHSYSEGQFQVLAVSRLSVYVDAAVLVFETRNVKDLAQRQFLQLTELFPVEVRYTILTWYLALL